MSAGEREALLRIFATALHALAREMGADAVSVYADASNGYADACCWARGADVSDFEQWEWDPTEEARR